MSYIIANEVFSTVLASNSVTYSCTFTNTWSRESHPVNYPTNAHWSPPVIAAHGNKYSMWKPGELASNGVKEVAETGDPAKLEKEVGKAMKKKKAGDVITGNVQFNSKIQEQTLPDIVMTPWFDRMSSITMIAPSPDWYSGFYNVKPYGDPSADENDPCSMVWYESFEIMTYPWDAGTEEGDRFKGNNPAEDPPIQIQQLTKDNVPNNGVLLNPDGTKVLPMATWSCKIKSGSGSCANFSNKKMNRYKDCNWAGKFREKSGNRCQKKYKGRPFAEWCPKACKVCNSCLLDECRTPLRNKKDPLLL